MTKLPRGLFAAGLFVLATGFTECEDFSTVTIPARGVDTRPPSMFAGVWQRGESPALVLGNDAIRYDVIPGEDVYPYAGGYDSGAVKRVTLHTVWSLTCCTATSCTPQLRIEPVSIQTQTGTVGSQVSNGVWAYASLPVPACPADSVSGSFEYSWQAVAEDFAGHTATGPQNRASWQLGPAPAGR